MHSSQIALRDFHGLLIFSPGTELDDLAILFKEGEMPRCHVVHIARAENLFAVGVPDPDATLEDVAPMGTLAAIIGQAFKQRRSVKPGGEALQRDVHLAPLHLLAAHAIPIKCYR